jgi:hypothetical protein
VAVTAFPDGYVIITPQEVYREVLATKAAVDSLAGRVDAVISHIPEQIKDQETRIRNLEMRVWTAAGVVALVVCAATILVPILV